jgi:hypothetical protein
VYTGAVPAKKKLGPKGGRTTRTEGGLVRKGVFIRADQDRELRRVAYEQERSESEIVRDALDAYLKLEGEE